MKSKTEHFVKIKLPSKATTDPAKVRRMEKNPYFTRTRSGKDMDTAVRRFMKEIKADKFFLFVRSRGNDAHCAWWYDFSSGVRVTEMTEQK